MYKYFKAFSFVFILYLKYYSFCINHFKTNKKANQLTDSSCTPQCPPSAMKPNLRCVSFLCWFLLSIFHLNLLPFFVQVYHKSCSLRNLMMGFRKKIVNPCVFMVNKHKIEQKNHVSVISKRFFEEKT